MNARNCLRNFCSPARHCTSPRTRTATAGAIVAMPDGTPRTAPKSTFDTLTREKNFKQPPKEGHVVPILNEFVTPALESFNALFDDSGLPQGDGDGRGLLSLGIADIGERVVFDGKGQMGEESGQQGWGNRLTSMYRFVGIRTELNSRQYGMSRYLLHDPWCPKRTRLQGSGKHTRRR